jgi:hypothetical protein
MILPYFENVLRACKIKGWRENHKTLTVDREGFKAFMREILLAMPFDEAWYLARYPDVAEVVTQGKTTARDHYVEFGYFEGRLPGLNGFDAAAYCRAYPDLAHLLSHPGSIELASGHFVEHGYREGRRAPSKSEASERKASR